MLQHRNRLIAAAGAVAAAGALSVSGVVIASASLHHAPAAAVSGTEHFQFVNASPTATKAPLIASGVFTASGTANTSNAAVGTFTFPNGTIKIRHSPGEGSQRFNPKTCLLTVNFHGTYRMVSGTGRYAGISGRGTYQLSILAIGQRVSGKCSMHRAPVAYQRIIRGTGPVSLP